MREKYRYLGIAFIIVFVGVLLATKPLWAGCTTAGPTKPELVHTTHNTDKVGFDTAVSGNYLYVTDGLSLTVHDISTPANTEQITQITGGKYMDLVGNYIYTARSNIFRVIDISTPSSPTEIGSITSANLSSPNRIVVSGNYAYVADGGQDALTIFDISTPSSPSEVGTITSATLDGASDVAVSGSYAYVAADGIGAAVDHFTVIDVSTPSSPTEVANISDVDDSNLFNAATVEVSGNYAYVGARDNFVVIDISTPTAPTVATNLAHADLGATGLALSGNYAYVVDGFIDDELSIVDISTPTSPSLVNSIAGAGLDQAREVTISGNYAYVASYLVGIFDISTPASLSYVAESTNLNYLDRAWGIGLSSSGNYAYVTGSSNDAFSIYDISTPDSPSQISSIKTTATLDSARGVAVSGNYAYVAAYNADRLTVVDISTPSNPTIAGSVNSTNLNGAQAVAISGNYAYVAAYNADRLTVVDISTPSSPTEVGSITSANLDGAYNVAVSGNYAYVVSDLAQTFVVIDVSTPASPSETTSIGSLANARGILISGNYAYVGRRGGTGDALSVIDISTPSSPSVVGTMAGDSKANYLSGLVKNGMFLYASGSGDVVVIDISDPTSPILWGHYDDPYTTSGVNAVTLNSSGDYLFMPNGGNTNQFQVFRVTTPSSSSSGVVTLGTCTATGAWEWDSANGTLRYCNGTNWVSMKGSGTDGSCSGTQASTLDYNTTLGNYRFCDGTNWIPLANNGAVSTCAFADPTVEYNSSSNILTWCNGSNWIEVSESGGTTDHSCVFVTSTTGKGNWTSLATQTAADTECRTQAIAAGLGGSFYSAWISNGSSYNPKQRFVHSSNPYKLVDGTTIANSWADLTDGTLLAAINLDETGAAAGANAWTGTNSDGTSDADDCTGWSSGGGGAGATGDGGGAAAGDTSSIATAWTDGDANNFKCGSSLPIYCFEQLTQSCLSVSAGDEGRLCHDKSWFVGYTPDGNVPMFIPYEDFISLEPWNDGNASGFVTTGTTSTTDGDGNTATLVATDSDSATGGTQPHQAAEYCDTLTAHGYDDWYLPASDELQVIYDNLGASAGIRPLSYWTSTEASATQACVLSFATGVSACNQGKNSTSHYALCVRKQ